MLESEDGRLARHGERCDCSKHQINLRLCTAHGRRVRHTIAAGDLHVKADGIGAGRINPPSSPAPAESGGCKPHMS